ncbi:MAG: S1 RNA-binding domain-containing protein [Lewinellaceae bacterium]|nr:S1 RNA-binding domain-containing protein [Lewinellaceae bacterium]
MNKFEQSQEAKRLLNSGQAGEAFRLYRDIWEALPEDRNEWDAFFAIKALRQWEQSNEPMDENLKATLPAWEEEMLEQFPDSEKVKNMYAWLLYDRHVKHFDENNPDASEPGIQKLVEVAGQQDKNLEEKDAYPCPATLGVLKLLKAYKKPNLNLGKTEYWLGKLAPEKLSRKEQQYETQEGKERKGASDFEDYCSLITNFLLARERYEECMHWCYRALNDLPELHYDNQIWFKRRIGLSLLKLGRMEEAEAAFEDILQEKAGQKWFIESELSELYLEEKEYEKALAHAVNAALIGRDYDKKARLFFNMSRIFAWLGHKEEGKDHAELIRAVNQKFDYQDRQEYRKMYKYFGLDTAAPVSFRDTLDRCRKHWHTAAFRGREQYQGTIKLIHRNGKSGILTREDGADFFFSIRELAHFNPKRQMEGAKVTFYLKPATDRDGNPDHHAEHIEVTSWPEIVKEADGLKVGDELTGVVNGVAPFGVFVKVGPATGLLHRSKIPHVSREEGLALRFPEGAEIKVRILSFREGKPNFGLQQSFNNVNIKH